VKFLDADHHTICKYINSQDQNYVEVRNVLRGFVNQLQVKDALLQNFLDSQELRKVQKLLDICEPSDRNLVDFYSYYMPGSCQRLISGQMFQNWLDRKRDYPEILWVNGSSGVGKSVLSSYIIQYLRERGLSCHFYYFRFEEEETKLPGKFLRSLAYQVANDIPQFRKQLALLSESPGFQGMEEGADAWKALLIEKLSEVTSTERIYWVVDAIDVCSLPDVLLDIVATLSASGLPLRTMLLSRRTGLLSIAFEKLACSTRLAELSMQADPDDISRYVREKIKKTLTRPDDAFTEDVSESILGYAGGNFLVARLALERVLQYDEHSEIKAALKELQPEQKSLYRRMEETMRGKSTGLDIELAKMTLSWVVCSKRQLTIRELAEALGQWFNSINDLSSRIDEICGGFVALNVHTSQIRLVDRSAEEYLTQASIGFRVELPDAHGRILCKCLSVLLKLDTNFPRQDATLESRFGEEALMHYALSSWIYHLSESGTASAEQSLVLLAKFLNGPCVLIWISIVACSARLQPLVEAAEALSSFLLRQPQQLKFDRGGTRIVQRWATNLLQITAKFGDHLIRYPRAIYSLVPAFCPMDSLVYKLERNSPFSVPSIRVTGLSRSDWDDCLARFSVRKDCIASRIICSDDYFAISTTSGKGSSADGCIGIYRIQTCEEVAMLVQGEPCLTMQFSGTGHLLATCSRRYIKIWTTPTDLGAPAELLCTLNNSGPPLLLALAFSVDDKSLITYSRDGVIRRISLGSITTGWDVIGLALGEIGTSHHKPPRCAAFNHDASLIAVGFRGAPITVWELAPFRPVHHHQRRSGSWVGVIRIEWNPRYDYILGLYDDGCVFKWQPLKSDDAEELQAGAINIKCSAAGKLFATSSGSSKLTIWDFERFRSVCEISLPDGVMDLAINPDGRRIYDLRESYCTIWKPITLMHQGPSGTAGLSEQACNLEGSLGTPNDITALTIPKDITALAVGNTTAACCTGNMDGVLQIISEDDQGHPFSPFFKAPIRHIAWSPDEKHLAIANSAHWVSVKAVGETAADEQDVFNDHLDASVQQLLFNKLSNRLFAATRLSLYIWDIGGQPRLIRKSVVHKQCRWVNHPGNDHLLLGFALGTLSILPWQVLEQEFDLETEPTTSYPTSQHVLETSISLSLGSVTSVEKVFISCDGCVIFLQISKLFLTNKMCDEFFILRTANISNLDFDADRHIKLVPLPRHLQASIRIPLAFVDAAVSATATSSLSSTTNPIESHLAFLSNEGWICTMYLGSEDVPTRVKSHYFLPRDWLVKDALELAHITTAGTLYCPKNGEVGVIRNGLRVEWTD
jgi:WD40 repeat protein